MNTFSFFSYMSVTTINVNILIYRKRVRITKCFKKVRSKMLKCLENNNN